MIFSKIQLWIVAGIFSAASLNGQNFNRYSKVNNVIIAANAINEDSDSDGIPDLDDLDDDNDGILDAIECNSVERVAGYDFNMPGYNVRDNVDGWNLDNGTVKTLLIVTSFFKIMK